MSGCNHYKRLCKIVAPCCNKVYWCRHCHNEDPLNDHGDLDRHKISEIVCAICNTHQRVSNTCINYHEYNGNLSENSNREDFNNYHDTNSDGINRIYCPKEFASYFCSKCNLWDDLGIQKKIFHCDECGICRVGSKTSYFHCKVCCMCYPTSIKDTHICIEKSCHQACPLCLENLFHSIRTVSILNCGHTIHESCLNELEAAKGIIGLRCPVCGKSITDNSVIWEAIDKLIADSPVPQSSKKLVNIFCNDCTKKCITELHPYGIKCIACGSYNTRVD
ncbi:CHY zinc finger domain-containing protein [Cryptosporidium muris RN66]|uniref:CHY zinc finger domain-containing protein n=1 Tax=Cryptosporidium muris (strain RN66) TaxID=441375 RepID=B6AI22_CRYMR|nr:CHY zinc finger domain-containing protein [Cryptosporidium muris RN66]EEA07863.1 CHY zinc finger domain-containing protein [Cryptosporidium muris RN66]|eukprot:XP_002142212.1 CHY zinc finger domain-containing protein [Cryptosporidium muris RN66]